MNNFNTTQTKTQAILPVWMVDYSAEVVSEVRTEDRSSDGKWLKKHVKLNVIAKVHTAGDATLAMQPWRASMGFRRMNCLLS